MSFLASLRTRKTENTQHLVLCYQFSINPVQTQLALTLLLVDAKLRIPKTAQSYQLQREHLQRPPAFMATNDQKILNLLSEADPHWFNNHEGQLPSINNEEILSQIIASKRSYFLIREQTWRPVTSGSEKILHPYWSINPSGDQTLQWCTTEEHTEKKQTKRTGQTESRPKKKTKKQPNENQLDLFSLFDEVSESSNESNENRLNTPKTTGKYWSLFSGEQALTLFSPNGKFIDNTPFELGMAACSAEYRDTPKHATLPAQTYFLNNKDTHTAIEKKWQAQGLPAPTILEAKNIDAQVKALLYFTGEQTQEYIQLKFSLCDEFYCSLPVQFNETAHSYWNNKNLIVLSDIHIEQKKQQVQINEHLSAYIDPETNKNNAESNTDISSRWQPETPENWQHIFSQLQKPLYDLGAEFIIEEGFRHHYIAVDKWQVNISANDSDLNIAITLHSEENQAELSELIAQLHEFNQKTGQQTAQLRDINGKIWLLPAGELSNLMEELEDLTITHEGFQLQRDQAHRLAGLQQQLPEETQWQGDTEALDHAIALHQSPVTIEGGLKCVNAQLRSYQWLGVCWIQHLKQNHCHGLLADDMGLGKTLQTLTHIAFEHQQGKLDKPALIVVPLSLVHNWRSEMQRFTPQLRYKIVHGGQRHSLWPELKNYDVLITTYHLAVADCAHWQQQELSWLILDEAQHIKNPSTRFSQALREIPSDHRLCLSGTPVENHLGELWSIMSFLMPGSLGSQKSFKQQFQRPIESEGNGKRLQQLLKRVSPFMLRRTKDQIAQDLPEKTEISQLIPLDAKQRDFYEQLKQDTWLELQSKMEEEGNSGQRHIAALTALMKLRQACCDPLLLTDDLTDELSNENGLENTEGAIPSAKREYCIEMITELVAENRAVLVFSQFTRMLDILSEHLNKLAIPCLTLTGKSQNRQRLVDDFQNGKAPVFLISLKAGGTGLNLTRADTVIHYDPWWNSAAQKQASDRAHRIGQDKPVFVYKLITEDTIEQKIEQLQNKKATLSEHVDNQAQLNAETFAFKFEELLELWNEDNHKEDSQKETIKNTP